MATIIPKTSSGLSKIWTNIFNLEKSLFPTLKEELREYLQFLNDTKSNR